MIVAQSVDALAREHAVAGARWAEGPGGLPLLVVETDQCRARVTPYGGQVWEWTPASQPTPVLFLSPRSAFAPAKAIRGGVPICFPWFGNHPSDTTKPAHGFARTRRWEVMSAKRDANGSVTVAFRLVSDGETRRLWDATFAATLTLMLGTSLAMTFEATNTGSAPIAYEIALHSYFTVGDIEQIRIHGLERTRFIDKVDEMKEKMSGAEALALTGETDRVFLDTTATCVIEDPVTHRRIRVEKSGSRATVVWNPWREKAEALADLGADTWRRFVCVETANCGVHAVRLPPAARHTTAAHIHVDS